MKYIDGKSPNGEFEEKHEKARVLMPTWRRFSAPAFRGGLFEAQDVFSEIDEVDQLCVEAGAAWPSREKWLRQFLWRDVSRQLIYVNPGLRPVTLRQDYELLVVLCQQWYELLYLNAVQGWRDRCRTAVCWLDEVYTADLPASRYWLNALNQFDHILVPYKSTADALTRILDRPCHCVPRAVDTLRFSPFPSFPDRVIDVLSVGKRLPEIHAALLDLAKQDGLFYLHDTFTEGGNLLMQDVAQHRTMFANMVKRSSFFMVAPGKVLDFHETKGQMEVGMRYYEGTAAGAVLLGQAPEGDTFHVLFDWPQAVVSVRTDGSDIAETIRGLQAEPRLLQEISARNVFHAAGRHDWLYRWQSILELAGLSGSQRLNARQVRLQAVRDHYRPKPGSLPTPEVPSLAYHSGRPEM
jgi:Glycosyl transferases group 1